MPSAPTHASRNTVPALPQVREVRVAAPARHRKGKRVFSGILFGVAILIYVLLRLRNLGSYSLWYDEVFSVVAARSSWSEMFRQILIDRVHPPLFYLCFKVWIAVLGQSVIRLRLFSVLFSVLTLLPMWICMRRVRVSSRVALVLLFAMACNPFLIFYGQELRMYALLGFLAACSLSFYLAEDENKTELWLLCLSNVLLVMTHAGGAAVVGGELAHALIARNRSRKYVVLACAPALASFACWMLSVRFLAPHPAMVLHNVSWIPKPTFVLAWKTLAHILGGVAALVALNVPIAIVSMKRMRDRQFLVLAILSIGIIACVLAFSILVRPVWQERYLIICVVPYYLLAGWSVAKLSPNWRIVGISAIALAALVSLEYDMTHRPDRPDFSSFVAIAKTNKMPVLSSYDIVASPLAFGIGDHDQSRVQVIKSIAGQSPGNPTFITRDIAYSVGQRDWIHDERSISVREFMFACDNSADALLPTGIKPTDLSSGGCNLQELATAHGQGHEFRLFGVNCH